MHPPLIPLVVPASAPVLAPSLRHGATLALPIVEPPRLVAVGAHEQTSEWKGRRVVYRHLPLNDLEIRCAVYAEGELANMVSFSSLSAQLESASASCKQLKISHFLESTAFRDKSRWVTRIFYTYSRNWIFSFL